jgi:hypothetical protein
MTRERAVGVFQSRHFWLFGALLFAARAGPLIPVKSSLVVKP